jgi:spore coat-associated protein N
MRGIDGIGSSTPRRILVALGVALLAGALATGSGANFKGVSSNPGSTITAGIVDLVNEKNGSATLTVVSLVPGHSASATTDLTNSGDVDADLTLLAGTVTDLPASPALSAKLDLVVVDLGDPGCTAPCPAPVTIYSGKLGALGSSALGRLVPHETHRVRFTVSFPDGGAGADNAYQLARSSLDMTWTLAQH